MKIPKTIKSQGITWTVCYNKEIEPLAVTDYHKQTITINPNPPKQIQEAAFIHELFHTFNTTMDHAFLDSISMQLYQVLSDNKMLK